MYNNYTGPFSTYQPSEGHLPSHQDITSPDNQNLAKPEDFDSTSEYVETYTTLHYSLSEGLHHISRSAVSESANPFSQSTTPGSPFSANLHQEKVLTAKTPSTQSAGLPFGAGLAFGLIPGYKPPVSHSPNVSAHESSPHNIPNSGILGHPQHFAHNQTHPEVKPQIQVHPQPQIQVHPQTQPSPQPYYPQYQVQDPYHTQNQYHPQSQPQYQQQVPQQFIPLNSYPVHHVDNNNSRGSKFLGDELAGLSIGKEQFVHTPRNRKALNEYQELLKKLEASGQKYTDPHFPPELKSLTGGLTEYELQDQGCAVNFKELIWLRPEEIWGKGKYSIFQNDIDPTDIDQGQLGHCYFLSTLASLAEYPHRVKKLFEVHQVNEQGCYAVKVCNNGIWETIILDDLIPCSPFTRKPIFSKCLEGELWVMLLEKAWAKIYGSYERIEAGLTRECLHDLTNAPTKYYLTGDPKKNEEIWEAISQGDSKKFIMTCGAGDFFEGADLMGSMGLVGSHAYSLLAAINTKDRYGRSIRLVKLRNPWGKGEWTGDWSDESSTWTEELKRELDWHDRDDGIFFMAYEDMVKYFSDLQICKIHDDYHYKAIKATCDTRHACYFKLTVTVPGHYYITVNQESKRKYPVKEDYQYSQVYLVVGKKVPGGFEYVEGYMKADKEVWTDGILDAGEYIIFAKIPWNNKRPKDFTVSAYGLGEVDIELVNKSYCPDFIEKVYMSKGRQSKKLEDYSYCGVKSCHRAVELTDDGFGFLYYKNDSDKTLEEEVTFKALEGLKLKKPYRGNNYKIVVPAGQEKIVITKLLPDAQRIRQAFVERARFV